MNNFILKSNQCLCCFEKLNEGESLYHKQCSIHLFETEEQPKLEFGQRDLEKLATEFLTQHIAVTGVQKKLSLELYSDSKSRKSRFTIAGALGGGYILKPPTNEYPFMPEIECLTMAIAGKCGIQVAPHGLIMLQDKSIAYITKRFDRIRGRKLACEDLCQLSELLTAQKYNSSAERTGKIIKKFSSFPGDDLFRYFELTVFCFLTGNADMHLKNFSLLTNERGDIRLSPAYDLLSTRLLIPAYEDNEELVLSVNGKKSNVKRKDFIVLAENLKIPLKSANYTMDSLLAKKSEFVRLIEKSFLPITLKESYVEIVHRRMEIIEKGSG